MARKTVVYIAGPMSGLADFNRYAFHVAARVRQLLGDKVFNPASLPDGLTEAQYMSICIPMIQASDMLYVLDGHENSLGVAAEVALAKKLDIPVVYQDGADHQTIIFGYEDSDA